MDHDRFDQLTVQLVHGATRRTLLHRLGGTSLAAFLGLIGPGHDPTAVAAKGHGTHRRRKADRHKRSETQDHLRAQAKDCGKKGGPCCAPDNSCRGKLNCVGGVCAKPDQGGGTCPTDCPAPFVLDAACQCVCPPGVVCCVDGACPTGQDCFNGICSCRGVNCTDGTGICAFGRTCQAGGNGLSCCCSTNGNTQVPCAPGPNAVCCSGFCGDDRVCAAQPV